jgi:hypothetical protein
MNFSKHCLPVLLALGTCTSTLATDPAAPAPAAAANAAAQQPATTNLPQEPPKTLRVPSEFRRKVVKGETLYCTTTTIIGSRFPKLLCVNEQGLRDLIDQREENQQALRRSQSICAGGAACGAN